MAYQNTGIFDLGPQNMFRIIRSARSRLAREQSADNRDDKSSLGSSQASTDRSSKRTSLSRSAFGRPRLSKSSTTAPCNSENVTQEKPHQIQTNGGGVLSDVTNTSVVPNGATMNSQANIVESTGQTKISISKALAAEQNLLAKAAAAPVVYAREQYECDAPYVRDPQHAIEYVTDIHQTLQREESHPHPAYMDRQVHVNAKMRGILVDWLVSVQQKYKLRAETLFLAVSLTDRYLELKVTARRNLQLLGITSLLIAAKYEEIHPPHVADFVNVTDKAYSKDEIVKMEVLILEALNFQICTPTPMSFLDRYAQVNGCTESHKHLAQYLLELSVVDFNMVKYTPSHLAAAAVLLSNKLQRMQPSWSSSLVKQTRFTDQMLRECAKEMCALLENAEHNTLQAVRKKFSQPKYNAVAKLSFTGPPQASTVSASASTASAAVDRTGRISVAITERQRTA